MMKIRLDDIKKGFSIFQWDMFALRMRTESSLKLQRRNGEKSIFMMKMKSVRIMR